MSIPQSKNLSRRERRARWLALRAQRFSALILAWRAEGFAIYTRTAQLQYVEVALDNPYRDW